MGKKLKWNEDRVFDLVNGFLLLVIAVVVAYPIYFIVIASVSDPTYVNLGEVILWPKGFTLMGYQQVAEYKQVLTGFINSVKYTVLGTTINLIVCVCTAFSLSRPELVGRRGINMFFVITMYLSGGLIPGYIVINSLKLTNTMWALILPTALNVYNMIVCRSFFQGGIPNELFESVKVDGGGYFTFFFKVVLPLSKPIIAVMILYHALVHWNAYTPILYYIRDGEKFNLQMVLRNLTEMLEGVSVESYDPSTMELQKAKQALRYAIVVISSIPTFLLYPFVQKYFVKGVMVGAVKG